MAVKLMYVWLPYQFFSEASEEPAPFFIGLLIGYYSVQNIKAADYKARIVADLGMINYKIAFLGMLQHRSAQIPVFFVCIKHAVMHVYGAAAYKGLVGIV